MRLFVIGDEDTVVGFRFAGVDGEVVADAQGASHALNAAVERGDAIVIVPEAVANMIRGEIDRVRFGEALPLVVEVPGPEGATGEVPGLFRLIRDAVGMKL